MSRLSEVSIHAFRDELRKEAGFGSFIAKNKGILQTGGAGAGVGALAGGALGAASGGVSGYREARNAGEGVGVSALHGLSRGLGSAAKGGLAGAAVGGLAGGVGGHMGGSANRLVARNDLIGSAARSGQRQVHSLTGMLSPSEFEGIRGGAHAARENFGKLQAAGKDTTRAAKALGSAQDAQNMGLTSIPGYLGAVKEHGIGKVLATNAKEQYHNMPKAMAALTLGVPALSAAHTLATPEDPNGPGKGERLGRELGNAVGGVAGGVMPIAGNAVVGGIAGRAGGAVGKVVDRMRGRREPVNDLGTKAPLEPTESQNTPSERITSPSAAGQQKDIGL